MKLMLRLGKLLNPTYLCGHAVDIKLQMDLSTVWNLIVSDSDYQTDTR